MYSTSKFGIIGLSLSSALEYARPNIPQGIISSVRINVVCPGAVDTPMMRMQSFPPERQPNPYSEEYRNPVPESTFERFEENLKMILPWGRLGLPYEIARTILFLSSDDASYITGTTINVDGGYLAGPYSAPQEDEIESGVTIKQQGFPDQVFKLTKDITFRSLRETYTEIIQVQPQSIFFKTSLDKTSMTFVLNSKVSEALGENGGVIYAVSISQ